MPYFFSYHWVFLRPLFSTGLQQLLASEIMLSRWSSFISQPSPVISYRAPRSLVLITKIWWRAQTKFGKDWRAFATSLRRLRYRWRRIISKLIPDFIGLLFNWCCRDSQRGAFLSRGVLATTDSRKIQESEIWLQDLKRFESAFEINEDLHFLPSLLNCSNTFWISLNKILIMLKS